MKYLRLLLVGLAIVTVGLLSIHKLDSVNQDIGRHLKSGQIIWENGAVYHTNLFSFTLPDQPFIDHHWFSEVVFYLLGQQIGLGGLIIFKGLVFGAMFAVVWLASRIRGTLWSFLGTLPLAVPVLITRTDLRPEMFSYLFFALFIWACMEAKYRNRYWLLYALPLVQVLWTNMHIYFAMGPLTICLLWLDQYTTHGWSKRLTWITASTLVATLFNPNFIKGALTPFTILKDYGYSIVENQNIFFLKDYGIQLGPIAWFEFSLVCLCIIGFLVVKKQGIKTLLFEFGLMTVCAVLALKMIRNFGLYAIAFVVIGSVLLPLVIRLTTSRRSEKTWTLALVALLILFVVNIPTNRAYGWIASSYRFGTTIPTGGQAALQFIEDNHIAGPVFNNFDVGSFLIWKHYPQEKVFVDGRPEAYSKDFFETIYKPMQEDASTWEQLSTSYNINYIFFDYHDITPWAQTFLNRMVSDPQWPIIYLDESTVVMIKNTPANRALITQFQKHL